MTNKCKCSENRSSSGSMDGVRYVISVGINNQRTNAPEMSLAMAEASIQRICSCYFDEYTIVRAVGGYRSLYNRNKYIEDQFNIELLNPSEDAVYKVVALLADEFDQSYIVTQKQFVSYTVYDNSNSCR